MRYQTITNVFAFVAIATFGCGKPTPPTTTDDMPPTVGDIHSHPSEGPHHGSLIELGSEEYHAELLHDDASVTVYLLDSSAKKSVLTDAAEVTISLMHDGKPEQFSLTASPEAGDPAGKTSRFVLADAELVGHLDHDAAGPKLTIVIDGIPYRGEVSHDHDHAGHDH